ncbi:MAG: polysaccharide biosynthesis tyrosine autokinase [Prevotella sp.]|nr:polysaccharide biosynthesis tyrosine autokinase [Prevotella sp.]
MAEETKNTQTELQPLAEEQSFFSLESIFRMLVLNWQWFVLSLIVALGIAFLYLRYTTPVYNTYAKILVKGGEGRGSGASQALSIGDIIQNYGLSNERQILKSSTTAAEVVRDLKLYASYTLKGRVRDRVMYKNQEFMVDMDPEHLEKLNTPVYMKIEKEKGAYHITGSYRVPIDELNSSAPYGIDQTVKNLPATIKTKAGTISIYTNPAPVKQKMTDGQEIIVTLNSPMNVAKGYAARLGVAGNEGSDVITLSINDQNTTRAVDYLNQMLIVYNRLANEDKNDVARRTEAFINERLAKINGELNATDSELESYKRRNGLVNLRSDASQSAGNQDAYEKRLHDANTQIQLINTYRQYINKPANKGQIMPSNVGLSDGQTGQLVTEYNQRVLERNRLLRTASEQSPAVQKLNADIDDLYQSVQQSLTNAYQHNMQTAQIQRNAISSQLGRYTGEISKTPEQERILTQIGRQQEVRSGLYLMLLQKREENSISLSATANKANMIEVPLHGGQVSPKPNMIYLTALGIGLLLPALIMFVLSLLRYRIEGHDDVMRLTALPILADVAIASDTAKTKADIVVHENKNNQMEEIFRSMRTNLQFMLGEKDKVIMFTSTTSGEGKTFNCANLAVSFALLGKKVLIVGLDIRKPRLAELFEINNHHNGITPLLTMEEPKWSDIAEQILPSGVNKNLDLLMAGPIPPNPAELMARPSLEVIFNVLRDKYDYILVDTAPVGLVTDTLQVGRVADATIYMCRADYTAKSSFELINGLANDEKLPNMSIVINGIDMSKKKYGYYYGYGRYGKYGRYGRYGRYSSYGKYGYGKYGYGRYGYGNYGSYGSYGQYGNYSQSHYGNKDDDSIKH